MTDTPRPVVPLRTTRRGEHSLLVRLPRRAPLIVDDVEPDPARALLALGASSSLELHAVADRPSTPAPIADLLDHLARAAERATLSRPVLERILVEGRGTLPASIGEVLRHYALDVVLPGTPADDGRPVGLVVDVTCEALDLDACVGWREQRVPVLPVLVRGDQAVVGPLLPTRGPLCARCLELHRLDRDPHRAHLLAGLDTGLRDPAQLDLDPAHAALVTGLVATLVRCLAHGIPVPPSLSLTARLPYPVVQHHEWVPHPRCDCVTMAP